MGRIQGRRQCALLAGTAMGFALAAAPALAQQAASAGDVEEVIVTGSRVARDGFETPTPLTAITKTELEVKATRNVVSLLSDIPALRPNQATQMTSSPPGAATLNLRGLGSDRTLVLLDGRRVAPTAPSGIVDVNVMPAPLISNIEVVTGGASAAYGSDAVSGVVNIMLDRRFEGLKVDAQYGRTNRGDAEETGFSASFGQTFSGGRGHLIASAEYYRNTGASEQSTRDWGDDAWAILANPATGAGQPRQLLLPGTRHSRMTDGGVIVTATGPLAFIKFGAGGAQSPFVRGTNVGATFMTGGDGSDFSQYGNLYPKLGRESAFARGTWDFTPEITGYVEGLYAHSTQYYDVTPNYNSGDLVISRDNAFLPANIRQIMTANNIATFQFGRTNIDVGGFNIADVDGDVYRVSGGLEGKIGKWSWDGYVQYSRNEYLYKILNNRNQQKWAFAVDSVLNASGQAVCRPLAPLPANATAAQIAARPQLEADFVGCVPMNLFGTNTATAAVIAYVNGTSFSDQHQEQLVGAANLRGDLFSTWAGPVAVATGFEVRKDEIAGTSDAVSQRQGWRSVNSQPLAGEINVKEAYAEVLIPLAKDMPLAENLEVDLAGRITDYSTSGTVKTWKVGVNYAPLDWVRLRATRSRDIRAPNVSELFTTQAFTVGPVIDRFTNRQSQAQTITGGNPNLVPEVGDTFTTGVVLQPFDGKLRLSVDYYNIELEGAIGSLNIQGVVDRCFQGQTDFCDAIVYSSNDPATRVISRVFATNFNAQSLKTRGFDFEAQSVIEMEDLGMPGQLRLRALATYIDYIRSINNGVAADTSGALNAGGTPHWRWNLSTIYTTGPWRASAFVRWIQGGRLNNTLVEGVDINDNTVSGRTYLDLSLTYTFREKYEVYGNIRNAFNTDPPVTANSLIAPQTATSPFFDVLGRYFIVGARARF